MKFLKTFGKPTKQYQDLQFPLAEKTHGMLVGWMNAKQNQQVVAASLAASPIWHATFDGVIGDLFILLDAVAGAGESMTVNVLKNGVSILSGAKTLDSTSANAAAAADRVSLLSLLTAAGKSFVTGDVFTVTRVYTAGGTPTPMTNTTVVLEPTVSAYEY